VTASARGSDDFYHWAATSHTPETVAKNVCAELAKRQLENVWKSKNISLSIITKLYESFIASAMLCSAEQ